eukprot:9766620-Karenia_brevis.AAC.1
MPGNHRGSQGESLVLSSQRPGLGMPGNQRGSQQEEEWRCCPQMVNFAMTPSECACKEPPCKSPGLGIPGNHHGSQSEAEFEEENTDF